MLMREQTIQLDIQEDLEEASIEFDGAIAETKEHYLWAIKILKEIKANPDSDKWKNNPSLMAKINAVAERIQQLESTALENFPFKNCQ